jgi:hypothetical protein
MQTFKLGDGKDTVELDPLGAVSQDGVPAGTWTTNADNKIIIRRTGGASATFDVAWKFNGDNQLTLFSDGREIFNFHLDPAMRPCFETRNGVLRVSPSRTNPFRFELRGDWDLTENHDLALTIGGVRSILSGLLSDPLGKFVYYFADQAKPLLKHKLAFAGSWDMQTEREGAIVFRFRREDGSAGAFRLPGTITINRGTNQLRYEYDKNGRQAIDFAGTLMVSPDFQVSYALNRQYSASGEVMVRETTLTFDAVYKDDNGTQGDLELVLKRPDGSIGGTTLAIKGSYTAVRGDTSLQVGYTFNQTRAGQTITTTFGFAGELKWSDGAVQWSFGTNNAQTRTLTLALGAQVQLGAASVEEKLNLEIGHGRIQGITFLLGVKF